MSGWGPGDGPDEVRSGRPRVPAGGDDAGDRAAGAPDPGRPGGAHLPADQLAELAAGLLEPPARLAAAEHLAGCAACRATRDELAAVTLALRSADPVGPIPDHVVRRLDAALAEEAAGRAAAARAARTPAPAPNGSSSGSTAPDRPAATRPTGGRPPNRPPDGSSGPVPLAGRRRRLAPRLLAAAASIVAIAGVGALVVPDRGDDTVAGSSPASLSAEAPADGTGESGAAGAAPAPNADDARTSTTPLGALAAPSGDLATDVRTLAASASASVGAQEASPQPAPDAEPDSASGAGTPACGTAAAADLGRELLASAAYPYDGRDAVLVALAGPTSGEVTGLVLPGCAAAAGDAVATVDVPRG